MSKSTAFSHDDDWKCLDELLTKLPRSISKSKAVVMAVEELNKIMARKSSLSLEDFTEENSIPSLEAEQKLWKKILKDKSAKELKELVRLCSSRKSLIEAELYRRL